MGYRTLGLCWLIALVATATLRAQPTPLQLDLERLLGPEPIVRDDASDPLWTFPRDTERQFVHLPFHILPDRGVDLSHTTLSFRGGRFIGWRIHREQDVRHARGSEDPQPPRLARRIIIDPQGNAEWKLERMFPGADLSGSRNPFALRIDPRLFEQFRPEPVRSTRQPNESVADFNERRRIEQLRFQEDTRNFQKLRELVASLPDTFQQADVNTVWAVIEVRRITPDIGVVGLETAPWTIGLRQLEALRQLAAGRSTQFDIVTVDPLRELARSQHPHNIALLAMALGRSKSLAQMQIDDPLYRLLQNIIDGPSATNARTLIEQVALTLPPTDATDALLERAEQRMTPRLKLLTLHRILHIDTRDPETVRAAAADITDALRDSDGPEPEPLIDLILQFAAKLPAEHRAIIADEIQFLRLQRTRFDPVIAAIIARAPQYELASHWLDAQLLSTAEPRLLQRTLEILARTDLPTRHLYQQMLRDDEARILIAHADHHLFAALQHEQSRLRELAWESLPAFSFTAHTSDGRRRTAPRSDDVPADLYRKLVDIALQQPNPPPQVVAFLAADLAAPKAIVQLVRLAQHHDDFIAAPAAAALHRCGQPLEAALLALAPPHRHTFARNLYLHLHDIDPPVTALMRDPDQRSPITRWFANQLSTVGLPDPGQWAAAYPNTQSVLQLAGSPDADLSAGAVAALAAGIAGDDVFTQQFLDAISALPNRTPEAVTQIWSQQRIALHARQLAARTGQYRLTVHIYEPDPAAPPRPRPRDDDDDEDTPPRPGAFPGATPPAAPTAAPALSIPLGLVRFDFVNGEPQFADTHIALSVPDTQPGILIDNIIELKLLPIEQLRALPLEEMNQPMLLAPQSNREFRGSAPMPDGRTLHLLMQPAN